MDNKPVEGAVEAIDFLREKDYPFRFVSNATQSASNRKYRKLQEMGFNIKKEEIFTAPLAGSTYIKSQDKKKCFLLTTKDIEREYEEKGLEITDKNPDYVVIGDAADNFSYANMNKAFNLLLQGSELIALEEDRYWESPDGLKLSAGPFVKALEYATGKKARLMGKPSPSFFKQALNDMNVSPHKACIIGDDIVTDIQGAREMGLKTILVKTGKFRKEDLDRDINPNLALESIGYIPEKLV